VSPAWCEGRKDRENRDWRAPDVCPVFREDRDPDQEHVRMTWRNCHRVVHQSCHPVVLLYGIPLRRAVLRCSSKIMDPSFVRTLGAIPRHYASRTPPSCHPVVLLYGIPVFSLFRRTEMPDRCLAWREGSKTVILWSLSWRACPEMILFRDQIQESYTGSRSPALSNERRCQIGFGIPVFPPFQSFRAWLRIMFFF